MEKPKFDYSKLRGKFVERYGNITSFCKATGYGRQNLYNRICGTVYFTQDEIMWFCKQLSIPGEQVKEYFFTPKL